MWDKIKELLGEGAPVLGTLLGGPMGGAVGNLISQALGVDNNPQAIEEALKNNPDSLLKLQELENSQQIQYLKHENDMKTLELENTKAYLQDTNGARSMQMEALKQDDLFSKRYVYYLATFWSIVGSVYIFMITFMPIPLANQRFADTILGFLVGTIVSTIIGYFFGSSKSSNDKNNQLNTVVAQLQNNQIKN